MSNLKVLHGILMNQKIGGDVKRVENVCNGVCFCLFCFGLVCGLFWFCGGFVRLKVCILCGSCYFYLKVFVPTGFSAVLFI